MLWWRHLVLDKLCHCSSSGACEFLDLIAFIRRDSAEWVDSARRSVSIRPNYSSG